MDFLHKWYRVILVLGLVNLVGCPGSSVFGNTFHDLGILYSVREYAVFSLRKTKTYASPDQGQAAKQDKGQLHEGHLALDSHQHNMNSYQQNIQDNTMD